MRPVIVFSWVSWSCAPIPEAIHDSSRLLPWSSAYSSVLRFVIGLVLQFPSLIMTSGRLLPPAAPLTFHSKIVTSDVTIRLSSSIGWGIVCSFSKFENSLIISNYSCLCHNILLRCEVDSGLYNLSKLWV